MCKDTQEEAGGEELLFYGIIQDTHIFYENGVSQVILTALTNEIKMDREEKSRSYQNKTDTYLKLMKHAVADTEGEVRCSLPAIQTGYPVIRYRETDWEFCRRMASNLGLAIYGDPLSPHPVITAGLPEKGGELTFSASQYRACVDEAYYHFKGAGKSRREFLYYEIESGENHEIRHLGIHTSRVSRNSGSRQLSLFDDTDYEKLEKLDRAVDSIREKYKGECYFRGQADCNWKVEPSIFRDAEKLKNEGSLMNLDREKEVEEQAKVIVYVKISESTFNETEILRLTNKIWKKMKRKYGTDSRIFLYLYYDEQDKRIGNWILRTQLKDGVENMKILRFHWQSTKNA